MRRTCKKAMALLIASQLCIMFAFSSCSTSNDASSFDTSSSKPVVKVSMYNNSSYPQWRTYIEKQCPDVYIEWDNNFNNTAKVIYQAEHNDMPDIVAIRRFESDSSIKLDKYLADLSDLDITDTFKPKYLTPYRYNGKQYWLPEPGAVDSIIASEDLFNQYNIDMPVDLDSFISACKELRSHGITPFNADFAMPWTATTILEGFGCPEFYSSLDGRNWISSFISGKATSVNANGTAATAAVIRRLKDNGIITPDLLNSNVTDVENALANGTLAMTRKSSDAQYDTNKLHKYTALPFFGKTASDSCLFTYPVFCLGMSKEAAQDSSKSSAVKEVLNAMLSADSQKILNQNTEGLISYCKDVDLPVSSSLDQIKPLIEQNRYTIRFLNSNTFSASTAALAALINDDADDKEYISILNRELFKSPADTLVATSSISAGNSLDSDMVSPSASVICTILKNQTKSDISVIDSDEATAPIYAAKYYTSDISAIVAPSAVYTASLTGTQIKDLLQACVVYSTTFLNGCIEPIIAYPALGGITVTMTKAGKITEIAESDGQALKGNSKYSIAVSGNIFNALTAEKNPLADSFAISSKNLQQYFTDGFVAADRLPKPSVYFKTN